MSLPVTDTLSRLFEHVPAYLPLRERSPDKQPRAKKSPGIFNIQKVAEDLETTVGDLLAEPGYESPRDLVSNNERRKLREAVTLLRQLFDLDDETLDRDEELPLGGDEYRFPVAPNRFIELDHDYPRALHAWVVPEGTAAAGPAGVEPEPSLTTARVLHSVREIWDSRLQVIRVIGDSMAPELRDGWKVLVDTERRQPAEDALVAVYLKDEGGVLGRWHIDTLQIELRKSNPDVNPIRLGHPDEWILWGTVTTVVEAPVPLQRD